MNLTENEIKTMEALTEYKILVKYLLNKIKDQRFIDREELKDLLDTFDYIVKQEKEKENE